MTQPESYLEVFAYVARRVNHLLELISKQEKNAHWIEKFILNIPNELQDDDRVRIQMDESWVSFYQATFSIARQLEFITDEKCYSIAAHLSKEVPALNQLELAKNQKITLNFDRYFSAVYESSVFVKALRSGIDCEFHPRKKGQKTPDLICKVEGVLIECKDSTSFAGVEGDDRNLIRKIQSLIKTADAQFKDIDPLGEFEHIICIDLPEQALSKIVNRSEAAKERFARNLFNLPLVGRDGTLSMRVPIIDNPSRVLLSDYDFGRLSEKSSESWPREPVWIPGIFQTQTSPRLNLFVQKFFEI